MTEALLQYVWKYGLFPQQDLKTTDGSPIEIIDRGTFNDNQGADFFNAKIRLSGQIWAGNIELHIRASDWIEHQHHTDKAYDSVILHVVYQVDKQIKRTDGTTIPQLLLPVPKETEQMYEYLTLRDLFLPCELKLKEVPGILLSDWISSLSMERLQMKSERIFQLLEQNKGNWQEATYRTLTRTLGFGLNNDQFEMLSRKMPLIFLQKHADSLFQVEALLFGQAGLLDATPVTRDPYFEGLKTEYQFLKHKFGLTPMSSEGWKFFRLRPINFPHQRIALLAQMVHEGFSLFTQLIEATEISSLKKLFQIQLTGYWNTHFTFAQESPYQSKTLGNNGIEILLINTAAPLLYAHGLKTGQDEYLERAITLLETLKPEQNRIIRQMDAAGIEAKSALDSQSLIQLHTQYCTQKKCIYCRIGHHILSKKE